MYNIIPKTQPGCSLPISLKFLLMNMLNICVHYASQMTQPECSLPVFSEIPLDEGIGKLVALCLTMLRKGKKRTVLQAAFSTLKINMGRSLKYNLFEYYIYTYYYTNTLM